MSILRDFNVKSDGFSFENFPTDSLDWDTYRRTYLSIWPTNDTGAAPLDAAFYSLLYQGCAGPGHCVGLSTLAITIWQLGGWFGLSSPLSFYRGLPPPPPLPGPESDDVRRAADVLHGRQFDAGNVQDVLQTLKTGHLNDGVEAFRRVADGLASGDLQLISIANGILSNQHGHCLLPYRCETLSTGEMDLYVWDSMRPYTPEYRDFYDLGYNRIRINSPMDWTYDQNPISTIKGGNLYEGSNHGWLFAFSSSAVRNKGSQPLSVEYALSDFSFLSVGGSASVVQIEDDQGRSIIETDAAGHRSGWRNAAGYSVSPWPWSGGSGSGDDLYLVAGADNAVTLQIEGGDYRLQMGTPGRLTVLEPHGAGSATDTIRIERRADSHVLELRTSARSRRYDVQHVHQPEPGVWAGVRVKGARVTDDAVRVELAATGDAARISGSRGRRKVDVEFERYSDGRLMSSPLMDRRFDRANGVYATPGQWMDADRTDVDASAG